MSAPLLLLRISLPLLLSSPFSLFEGRQGWAHSLPPGGGRVRERALGRGLWAISSC